MKRFILLLAMAVFTIIAISSCTAMRDLQYQIPSKDIESLIIVNILTEDLDGNKPKVVPRWVMLRYGTNQQVRWIIDQDVKFTIKFNIELNEKLNKNGSPFEEKEFHNERPKSGRAVVDPGEKDEAYWYSVEVDGFEPIDPGIIIWD